MLITGSTDGLGKLLAINLAKSKLNIIVHGRDENRLKETLNELNKINPSGTHSYILCDLNHPNKIEPSFSEIKNLDILINNAGIWLEGNTIDAEPEKITDLINVNLSSYILIFRTLLPALRNSDFGQVLNVISVAGYEIPCGYYHTIYTATKYGLQGFSEATTKEFENTNIRVMGFYPGGMSTSLFKKAGENYSQNEGWMFNPQEAVDTIWFMLTRDKKINIKRLDLVNHLEIPPF